MAPDRNVLIVRELFDAFERRDNDRAFELYDPEIEWDASAFETAIPDAAGIYHGHEGVRTFWRRWLAAWKEIRFDLQDVRATGDQVVALVSDQHHIGRHSGIVTDFPPYAILFTLRDAKVVRWEVYLDQRQALAAAGLEA